MERGTNSRSDHLRQLEERLREFRDARDWQQFHNPKDLAAAIAVEAAELQQEFLWVCSENARNVLEAKRVSVENELADVLIQCLNFAAAAHIDVLGAIERKVLLNEERYPVDKARGRATKYTHL